jgi:UDP-GlcNAc3NAcA epimerase
VARLVSVLGNRPQYVKAAPVHLALRERSDLIVIDTGQHYDYHLSGVFYEQLGLAPPQHSLGVGSGSHAVMTARIMTRCERVLVDTDPDWVVVYGDTNSTLGAALAAAKLGLRVAHVEAGLRSHDRSMPEEVNRVLTDHVAGALFCPSQVAADNLAAEGIRDGVAVVGDVMVDAARLLGPRADQSPILSQLGLGTGDYLVATVHREANTRMPGLARIVAGLNRLPQPTIAVLHPRTSKALRAHGLALAGGVRVIEPLGYLDFTALLRAARGLVTDSGGAQKEAYFHGVPCVTLRRETEWVETVASGWNTLVGDDPDALVEAVDALRRPADRPPLYGDGHAAERIAAFLVA